jgi:hypothetical protein
MLSHEFKPRSQGGLIVGWRSGGNLWAQQSGRIGKVPEIRFFFLARETLVWMLRQPSRCYAHFVPGFIDAYARAACPCLLRIPMGSVSLSSRTRHSQIFYSSAPSLRSLSLQTSHSV